MSSSRLEGTEYVQQMLIDGACDCLYQIGFNRKMFTVSSLRRYLHADSHKKFLELIEPISYIKDLDALRLIFKDCTRKDSFNNFKSHVEWLKTSDEGRLLLDDSLRPITKPLKKSEVDLARRLVEYGNAQKQAYKDVKEDIVKIQQTKAKKQRRIYKIDDQLEIKLGPIRQFQELSIHDLRIKAYQLYKNDCKSKGIDPIPYYMSNGYETAVEAFGKTVKETHFRDFLNQPSMRMQIANHFSKSNFNPQDFSVPLSDDDDDDDDDGGNA